MAISETKMQMVIANYFKDECDVNTSIRQAFEKGFRIGVKKGASTDRPQGKWIKTTPWSYGAGMGEVYGYYHQCSNCDKEFMYKSNYCPNCGARMLKGERVDD